MNNRHKIFEPNIHDVLSNFPEYKTVKKYERIEKDFIDAFLNLMSDKMYLNPPSDGVRDSMLQTRLNELKIKIRYQYDKNIRGK